MSEYINSPNDVSWMQQGAIPFVSGGCWFPAVLVGKPVTPCCLLTPLAPVTPLGSDPSDPSPLTSDPSSLTPDPRAVWQKLNLAPGSYVILASTYRPNIPGDFCLRIFSKTGNTLG